jgi:hypothetical protein
MLCYVVLYHVMLCYVMLCYVMLCYVISLHSFYVIMTIITLYNIQDDLASIGFNFSSQARYKGIEMSLINIIVVTNLHCIIYFIILSFYKFLFYYFTVHEKLFLSIILYLSMLIFFINNSIRSYFRVLQYTDLTK